MKKIIIILFLIVLIITFYEKGMAVVNWDQMFSHQVNSWIKEFSENNMTYSIWEKAQWNSQSYGPNSRQWLITISQDSLTVGHLVIGENEDRQLFVIEYGIGEKSWEH